MVPRVGPGQYLHDTGRMGTWVARRMGISSSYLSLLLSGKRRWTPALRERFAAAVDRPQSTFDYAQTYTRYTRQLRGSRKMAVEAPSSHAERVDVSVEYPRSSGAGNGSQEANCDGRTDAGSSAANRRGVGSDPDAARVAEEG